MHTVGAGRKSSKRSASGRRVGFALVALFATSACSNSATWPVPVPYATDGAATQRAWRLELELPLPAACAALTPATLDANQSQCPQLKQLADFMRLRAAAFEQPDAKQFAIDAELWSLLTALAKTDALKTPRFPRDAAGISKEIRGLDTFSTLDARDNTPPQGRSPVAFSYRHFWWTFWLKNPPPPPPPDAGGSFNGSDAFDKLILFPEFQGRVK